MKLFLNVFQTGNLEFCLLQAQTPGIVGVELLNCDTTWITFNKELVVVQVAVIGRNTVKVPHILGLGALFLGQEGLVHLLTVPDTNDLDILLLATEELTDGLGLDLDGAGGGFLDEDVAVLAVLEGEEDEVDGLLEAHDEAGHGRFREGDWGAGTDLVNPERNDAAAAAHDVAVAGAANAGIQGVAALGHRHLLLQGLADAHRIDRICGLVRRQTNHALHARVDGRIQHIVRADDIGLHRLHREELARRDLLERRRMEDVIDPADGGLERGLVAYVADIELDLVRHLRHPRLEVVPHVVLLLFVARENPDFADVGTQEAV